MINVKSIINVIRPGMIEFGRNYHITHPQESKELINSMIELGKLYEKSSCEEKKKIVNSTASHITNSILLMNK